MDFKNININDYTYQLPTERIAKYPLAKRDKSNLLTFKEKKIEHQPFSQLSNLLNEDDLVIFNDTRVIQARLQFQKTTGAKIEIFCLEPIEPHDFALAFSQKGACQWKCIVGNSKKWKTGHLTKLIDNQQDTVVLTAKRISSSRSSQLIEFSWEGDFSFGEILESSGETPIPPYLNRKAEVSDKTRYQTVYSKIDGSVAAPTAGLHFTDKVFSDFQKKGIETAKLTLHVGAGTFKPVKTDTIGEHEMHTEHFFLKLDLLEQLLRHEGKIVAVGTTTVRTLESVYWLGVRLLASEKVNLSQHISQWEVYDLPQDILFSEAIVALQKFMKQHEIEVLQASTQIIIVPTYRFRVIAKLITNFHQPQSTLLLLIAAFVGENWREIYNYALENDFRFLSYGDSSLLHPAV